MRTGRIAGWLGSESGSRPRRHATRRPLPLLFTSRCPAPEAADVKLGARRLAWTCTRGGFFCRRGISSSRC
eukprot:603766-Rhodomonas_salina.3